MVWGGGGAVLIVPLRVPSHLPCTRSFKVASSANKLEAMQLPLLSPRILRVPEISHLRYSRSTCIIRHTYNKRKFTSSISSSTTRRSLQPAVHHTPHISQPTLPIPRSTQFTRNMSSDADYTSFLDKANQDTGSAEQQSSLRKKSYGTKSVDTVVPQTLAKVEEYYVSDADEPFEPVALKYDGSSLSAGTVPACFMKHHPVYFEMA
jgi:hypothetical protein